MRDDKSMPGRPQTSSFCVALLLFFQKGIVYTGGGVVNESCPINPKCLIWGTDTKKFTVYLKFKFHPIDLHLLIFSLFLLLSLATHFFFLI